MNTLRDFISDSIQLKKKCISKLLAVAKNFSMVVEVNASMFIVFSGTLFVEKMLKSLTKILNIANIEFIEFCEGSPFYCLWCFG